MSRWRRRGLSLIAGLLMAALAQAALEGFLLHTDDGCRTEIHCVACRTGLARTAVQAATPTLEPVTLTPVAVPPLLPRSVRSSASRTLALRGPPTA